MKDGATSIANLSNDRIIYFKNASSLSSLTDAPNVTVTGPFIIYKSFQSNTGITIMLNTNVICIRYYDGGNWTSWKKAALTTI